jgi:hypothetical protein
LGSLLNYAFANFIVDFNVFPQLFEQTDSAEKHTDTLQLYSRFKPRIQNFPFMFGEYVSPHSNNHRITVLDKAYISIVTTIDMR